MSFAAIRSLSALWRQDRPSADGCVRPFLIAARLLTNGLIAGRRNHLTEHSSPFHGGNTGSNPVGDASNFSWLSGILLRLPTDFRQRRCWTYTTSGGSRRSGAASL